MAKIEANTIFRNFLRPLLIDLNSSRSGQWVFDDPPRTKSLGDAQFPRIAVTLQNSTTKEISINDRMTRDTATVQIDILAKKSRKLTYSTTDEALGTLSSSANNQRLDCLFLPTDKFVFPRLDTNSILHQITPDEID